MDRVFSHGDLHRLTDADPARRTASERIHALAAAVEWNDWVSRKAEMIRLWASAVGCRNGAGAIAGITSAVGYFNEAGFPSMQAWRACEDTRPHLERIAAIESSLAARRVCHAPGGNSYRCFCDLL